MKNDREEQIKLLNELIDSLDEYKHNEVFQLYKVDNKEADENDKND